MTYDFDDEAGASSRWFGNSLIMFIMGSAFLYLAIRDGVDHRCFGLNVFATILFYAISGFFIFDRFNNRGKIE